jgi:hypothetical protein
MKSHLVQSYIKTDNKKHHFLEEYHDLFSSGFYKRNTENKNLIDILIQKVYLTYFMAGMIPDKYRVITTIIGISIIFEKYKKTNIIRNKTLDENIKEQVQNEGYELSSFQKITYPVDSLDLTFDTNPNIHIDDKVVDKFNNSIKKKKKKMYIADTTKKGISFLYLHSKKPKIRPLFNYINKLEAKYMSHRDRLGNQMTKLEAYKDKMENRKKNMKKQLSLPRYQRKEPFFSLYVLRTNHEKMAKKFNQLLNKIGKIVLKAESALKKLSKYDDDYPVEDELQLIKSEQDKANNINSFIKNYDFDNFIKELKEIEKFQF